MEKALKTKGNKAEKTRLPQIWYQYCTYDHSPMAKQPTGQASWSSLKPTICGPPVIRQLHQSSRAASALLILTGYSVVPSESGHNTLWDEEFFQQAPYIEHTPKPMPHSWVDICTLEFMEPNGKWTPLPEKLDHTPCEMKISNSPNWHWSGLERQRPCLHRGLNNCWTHFWSIQ